MPELMLGLTEVQRELAAGRRPPPVERWNPSHCGAIDIRILRDGRWLHQGAPIRRHELVRLFSTILRKEGANYYLVTPIEKMRIQVEDTPFMATLMEVQQTNRVQRLVFTTNVGDAVVAGKGNPICLGPEHSAPYVQVRSGLEARLSRNVFYQLAELAEPGVGEDEAMLGVWSDGVFFPLGWNR